MAYGQPRTYCKVNVKNSIDRYTERKKPYALIYFWYFYLFSCIGCKASKKIAHILEKCNSFDGRDSMSECNVECYMRGIGVKMKLANLNAQHNIKE